MLAWCDNERLDAPLLRAFVERVQLRGSVLLRDDLHARLELYLKEVDEPPPLHVIDAFVDHGFGAREEVVERMRQRAFDQLAEFKTQATDDIVVDVIVVEGRPFLQILQKAEDFAVDAIVMGKVGWQGRFEKVLFGSTVDKVMRGAARPVMVLPG